MSRYRGPRFKLVKRFDTFLPGLISPGVYVPKKKKKKYVKKEITYSTRLQEKQKLRFHYGITERQLLRYVRSARRSKGSTGEALLQLLEMRLDNIVYRAGLAPTVPSARQLVNHGHIAVNDHKVDIPSYRCRLQDQIERRLPLSPSMRSTLRKRKTPYHLAVTGSKVGVRKMVQRQDVGLKIEELLVVEYYSRQV